MANSAEKNRSLKKVKSNLFPSENVSRFEKSLYLCTRKKFSKTENFFPDDTQKVFQNGKLLL